MVGSLRPGSALLMMHLEPPSLSTVLLLYLLRCHILILVDVGARSHRLVRLPQDVMLLLGTDELRGQLVLPQVGLERVVEALRSKGLRQRVRILLLRGGLEMCPWALAVGQEFVIGAGLRPVKLAVVSTGELVVRNDAVGFLLIWHLLFLFV